MEFLMDMVVFKKVNKKKIIKIKKELKKKR